jgi:threonine/homoserine/homoserine lactone efflux protein
MVDVSSLAMPFFASLALVIVPGPAVLYIITRSVDQGRAAGFTSAAGIATGGLVHVAGAALGLSAIIASSSIAFSALKYFGAAYLIFLGIRTLLTKPDPLSATARSPRSMRNLYSQGVVVQALNPKVALFFLAFLPQFIDPSRGSVVNQTLVLGAMFITLGLCTDSLYAFVAGGAGEWLRRQAAFGSVQRYAAGSVFIGLGLTTALSGAKSK